MGEARARAGRCLALGLHYFVELTVGSRELGAS